MNKKYEMKTCAHCGVNGTVKKFKLIFRYSYAAKCCFYCIEKLGGIENTRKWLEKHAQFNNNGQYWFE
jgi:hypothetical protein